MKAKKMPSIIGKFALNLLMAFPALFSAVIQLSKSIETDARLVGRNLFNFVLLSFACLSLLLTSWFCLMGILYLFLLSLHLTSMISLIIMLVMNILLLVIMSLCFVNVKNKLFFPKIRRLLLGIKE